MNQIYIDHIKQSIKTVINKNQNIIFDELIKIMFDYSEKPCHNLQDLQKNTNKKIKGDIFEHFCYLYGIHIMNLKMYFLKDVDSVLRQTLKITKNDMGIDLIGVDDKNNYYAFQVKFRKPSSKITQVGWKELSTFYAMVLKCNTFHKHVVFTNCNGIRHIGDKSEKDLTIAIGTLRKLNSFDYCKIIDVKFEDKKNEEIINVDDVRNKRLLFFDNLSK